MFKLIFIVCFCKYAVMNLWPAACFQTSSDRGDERLGKLRNVPQINRFMCKRRRYEWLWKRDVRTGWGSPLCEDAWSAWKKCVFLQTRRHVHAEKSLRIKGQVEHQRRMPRDLQPIRPLHHKNWPDRAKQTLKLFGKVSSWTKFGAASRNERSAPDFHWPLLKAPMKKYSAYSSDGKNVKNTFPLNFSRLEAKKYHKMETVMYITNTVIWIVIHIIMQY